MKLLLSYPLVRLSLYCWPLVFLTACGEADRRLSSLETQYLEGPIKSLSEQFSVPKKEGGRIVEGEFEPHPYRKGIQVTFTDFGDPLELKQGDGFVTEFSYDDRGHLFEMKTFEEEYGELRLDNGAEVETDSAGRKLVGIKWEIEDGRRKRVGRLEFAYNAEGRNERARTYDAKGMLESEVWTYYSDGKAMRLEFFNESEMTLLVKFEYNDSGHQSKMTRCYIENGVEVSNSVTSYQYTFDEYGNWVTRHGFEEGELSEYVAREFEYR